MARALLTTTLVVSIIAMAAWRLASADLPVSHSGVTVVGAAVKVTQIALSKGATFPVVERTSATSLVGATVLETATADDTGPGSALLRNRDGDVRRVPVGSWVDGGAILTAVTDSNATFASDGRRLVLQVTPMSNFKQTPLSSGAEPYIAPAVVNPGIARH